MTIRIKRFVSEWPLEDQTMWHGLFARGNALDDLGELSHLRQSTVSELEVKYGRWIAWLQQACPEALREAPSLRATPQRVNAWMTSLAALAPFSRLMFLDAVLRILICNDPNRDWAGCKRIRHLIKAEAEARHGSRKTGRVLSSAVLLQAGCDLADLGAAPDISTFEGARRLRDGAMLAFLALMPIRRRSFTFLDMDGAIRVGKTTITVTLSEEMTKTGVPWEADTPEPLAVLLLRYMSDARPFLIARTCEPHNFLWVSDTGRPYAYGYLGRRITELTEKMTGVRVPPHFFRDAAATTLARQSPEDAHLIRALLGHAGFRTAERHYNHARAIDDGRAYASLIAGMKKGPTR